MTKIFTILILILAFYTSKAQIKAVTENGKEVTLFNNGTWKYSTTSDNDSTSVSDSLKVNPIKFSKSASATFLAKSNVAGIGVYLNPKKWTFSPHNENEVIPEYKFSFKSSEALALLATEKIEIGLDNMRYIALRNAQKAAIDAKIVHEEYRIVNGKKMLCLEMTGTIKGINFVYFGYYYSDANGTTQLLSFTSKNLYSSLRGEMETFLNGLVPIDKK